jgi:hypothetical protein
VQATPRGFDLEKNVSKGANDVFPFPPQLVFLSSGAALGNMIAPGLASAEQPDADGVDWSQSGLVTGRVKPLKHESIPDFLSAAQIAPHHTAHYGGALRGYLAADTRLEEVAQAGGPIDAAVFGALKRTINSRGNSVVLHEMYFDGLASQSPSPAAEV